MFKNKNKELYFEEVKKQEEIFYNLTSHFNTNFPKILNLKEEKNKFFKALIDDKVYNPFFKFEKKEFDEIIFEKLKNLKIDTKNDIYNFKKLLKLRLKTKIYELECHKNWGKEISSKYVKKYRGYPRRYLLSLAKNYCKNFKREKVKFKKINVEKVAKELKDEVKNLTGNKIKVKFENINSKVNILPSLNLIQLNPNEKFTSLDLKRLKVHEIGVHYMRYFNGKKTNLKILEVGTSNYIETEEGLAVYFEELKGVSSKAQMYIYAGRVIATFYATRISFYEVFKILKYYGFRDEAAWILTQRAKRNICDTSKAAGFTKDYVYFSGYLKVKKFIKNGGNLNDLFIGKIKIEDLKYLKKFILEMNSSSDLIN